MSDPAANFATPRVAAGALFADGDRVLLVHKTYGNGWDPTWLTIMDFRVA